MKIGNPADKPVVVPATNNGALTPNAAAGAGAIPVTADDSAKIELSSSAATLMSSDVSADFDAEKVARMSEAIDNGTFKINPDVIADKLIANAHEALAKVQP
jgi:negative regulator of flagellin synthesis FlgM